MKKGFTLLELIVVIVILGILGSLGFTQYTKMIEKGRAAEAKSNLGMLRKLQLAYYQDKGAYSTDLGTSGLDTGLPSGSCNTNFYFQYSCNASGICSAGRCTGGGKTPNATTSYDITLDINGTWGGTAGWY